jgi:hypothetical protein
LLKQPKRERRAGLNDDDVELRPKKVEGAKWQPGQKVYKAFAKYELTKLVWGTVKTVRKDGLEMVDRCEASSYKAVAPFNEVFPTEAEAWADAARRLTAKAKGVEKELADLRKHIALAEKKAKK